MYWLAALERFHLTPALYDDLTVDEVRTVVYAIDQAAKGT